MPAEENRAVGNLLLLCIEHSYEIDDSPDLFPADMLREWKAAQLAEYDRLQTSWPITEDEATEVLVESESFDVLHAPATIELVRRVEALRLVAERTRLAPRSWSRKWRQLRERTQRSFIAWDQDGNALRAEPSEMDVRPIREGIASALDAAFNEVTPAAEVARIELAAVRATRTQVAPWCDALERSITHVIDMASRWTAGPDPEADTAFDTALADLQRSVTDLVRASRGEQVDMPEPPQVVSEYKAVDPLAEHRELLDEARPFSRVDHRPYDPDLRERVAKATRQAANIPPTLAFLTIGLDTTARLAIAVGGNASEGAQLDLVERDRARLPICAAVALLSATTHRGDGQTAPATAAREQLRRLWSETDWASATSWMGNDVYGRSMMQNFAHVTSDEEVRDRLAQALDTNPEVLTSLILSSAGWVEEHDSQTGLVRLERIYDEPPPWLPIGAITALATGVLGKDHGLDDGEILEALLRHASSGS
ncbi:hypothetical protein [Mycolicibacterium peregrinum]|uniref:hypothetical protein n=1 Tax=Mycolicibacterium peregrinum TaxID=43304 RepID=UPI003AAAD285